MFCPHCDYAWNGLPQEGICPECGRPYDQSHTIIRCLPRGNLWVSGVIIVALVLVATLYPSARMHPAFLLPAGVMFIGLVAEAIERLTSPRKGEQLLWMSAEGIGVRHVADESALHVRFGDVAASAFVVGFLAYLVSRFLGTVIPRLSTTKSLIQASQLSV